MGRGVFPSTLMTFACRDWVHVLEGINVRNRHFDKCITVRGALLWRPCPANWRKNGEVGRPSINSPSQHSSETSHENYFIRPSKYHGNQLPLYYNFICSLLRFLIFKDSRLLERITTVYSSLWRSQTFPVYDPRTIFSPWTFRGWSAAVSIARGFCLDRILYLFLHVKPALFLSGNASKLSTESNR
jgi:hypothetical protein